MKDRKQLAEARRAMYRRNAKTRVLAALARAPRLTFAFSPIERSVLWELEEDGRVIYDEPYWILKAAAEPKVAP